MHTEAMDFVTRVINGTPPKCDTVLEVGSLNVNGSVRDLFTECKIYVGIDLVEGPGVDVVADIRNYTPDHLFDIGVSTEALEHDPDPASFLDSLALLCDQIILTCAAPHRSPHSVDGGLLKPGEYYGNVTPDQITLWASTRGWILHRLEHNIAHGDLYFHASRAALTR